MWETSDPEKYELIPGKLCLGPLGKGRAFYLKEGREVEATKFVKIDGTILPAGVVPDEYNAVGLEWAVQNRDQVGNYYIGAAKVNDKAYGIGKVRNGLLHHGYAGIEI